MNPENLQTIANIINSLGEDTKMAFFWYLGATVAGKIICASAWIFSLCIITRLFRYAIDSRNAREITLEKYYEKMRQKPTE